MCPLSRAHVRAHYFVRYLNVLVKISTLGSNVSVALPTRYANDFRDYTVRLGDVYVCDDS